MTTSVINFKKGVFIDPKKTAIHIVKTSPKAGEFLQQYAFKDYDFIEKLIKYSRHVIIQHGVILPKHFTMEFDFKPFIDSDDRPCVHVNAHIITDGKLTHTLHEIHAQLDNGKLYGYKEIVIQPKNLD